MAPAIFSNSARVITVWQPAPVAAPGCAGLSGHSPLMVNTAASEATATAEGGTGRLSSSSSTAAAGLFSCGVAAGLLCPQARMPNQKQIAKKKTSQQLRMSGRLQKQVRKTCKVKL